MYKYNCRYAEIYPQEFEADITAKVNNGVDYFTAVAETSQEWEDWGEIMDQSYAEGDY